MQLVYTMFMRNNRSSFHLWWMENLIKHQKVSKSYKNGCSFDATIFSFASIVAEIVHTIGKV